MGDSTGIMSVLHLSVNDDFIYLTLNDEQPQTSSFILNIRRRDIPVGQKVRRLSVSEGNKAAADPSGQTDGRPGILIGFDWKNDIESLCREGEQKNIRITQENRETGNEWEVSWEAEETLLEGIRGCWKIKPSADVELDTEFSVSLLFQVGVTKALRGGAVMYVMGRNIPGFSEDSVSVITIHKIYPITLSFTQKPPAYVEAGDQVMLSWDVKNAEYCTLNYTGCNAQGTWKEIIREPKTYMLTAQNTKGRIRFLRTQVDLTNWSRQGDIDHNCFPKREQGSGSIFDYRIYEYKNEQYLYDDRVLYKSAGGMTWSRLSECSLEAGKIPNRYVTILWRDRFYLIGSHSGTEPGQNQICYYAIEDKTWHQEELITEVDRSCSAVTFKGVLLYYNMIGEERIAGYRYDGEYWNTDSMIRLEDILYDIKKAEAFDAACFADRIYLAVKDKESRTVALIYSRDGYSWEEYRRLDIELPGWFRLVSTGSGLLLIYHKDVISVINDGKEFHNFLPEISMEWENKPWCGFARRAVWLITEEKNTKRPVLWRFRE